MQETPKKRLGPIAWIKTYGYYYKGLFALFAVLIVVGLSLIFLYHYDAADYRLYMITEKALSQETSYRLQERLDEFVYDVDGDSTAIARHYFYALGDGEETLALDGLPAAIENIDSLAFFVDEAGYDYLTSKTQLRDLSYFEIESDEDSPYRLTINDTVLLEELDLPGDTVYYLVIKYIDNTQYNDVYISGRTDIIVGMARNIDRSDTNDVEIPKKK